ncbi:MAG: C25 family cysteine peptidase [Anaerolineae bacterium]
MRRLASRARERLVLLISSRGRLTRRYGSRGFQAVDSALRLVQRQVGDGRAVVAYLDDDTSMRALGGAAVSATDAGQVRAAVARIEANLGAGDGATLWIVGGDAIVPFFRVANPADDSDGPMLTDAPYACAGDDYFHPVRSVARLLDGGRAQAPSFAFGPLVAHQAGHVEGTSASGYTASVWREAARDVFSVMGPPSHLRMSPPWGARDYYSLRLAASRLRYYNLHGKPDGAVWYGQTDPSLAANYPDFPVAMRQSDVSAAEAQGAVVVSEACYGASLAPLSVAGRFMRLGAAVFLGSTAMAYGAITPPVTGADLLAKEFVRHLLAGVPAGEAFLLAKTAFARTMMAEQGFLDPEDQKTLLSFVLFGDPTFALPPQRGAPALPAAAAVDRDYEVVCARNIPTAATAAAPSLLAELEQLATAIMGNSAGPLLRCRQETCSDTGPYQHGRLSGGRGQVLSIRQRLGTGAERSIRVTVVDGRIRKALVSK